MKAKWFAPHVAYTIAKFNMSLCTLGHAAEYADRGVAVNSLWPCQRALVVPDKAERVHQFHRTTLKALSEMLAAAGIRHPSDLRPHHLARRISQTEIKLFSQLHVFLRPGELLTGEEGRSFYSESWRLARADRFDLEEPATARV